MRRAALALAMASLAPPAWAQDLIFFRSPSGNIACLILAGDDPYARCDILEATPSFTERPADCDLDWGQAFGLSAVGQAEVICAGDTVATSDAAVLDYGQDAAFGSVSCRSERSGMTCRNAAGHGFTLSRARQTLF